MLQDFQFILLALAIFLIPFIPAGIFAWKLLRGLIKKSANEGTRLLIFAAQEVLGCSSVLALCFYFSEIAPHQGVVSAHIFSHKSADLDNAWDIAKEALRLYGCLSGVSFMAISFKLRHHKRAFWGVVVVGGFCLAYAVMVPTFMTMLAGAIRDSFLIQ